MLSRKAVLCVTLLFASTLVTTATAQTAAAQPKGSPAPEKVIAIHAANLIDGVSTQVRHNVLILIKGNRIESVTSGGNPPAGATIINLPADITVLPGLIDTHTHIFLQGEDPAEGGYDIQLLKHPSSYRAARAAVAARRALEQGFTTLRDVETEGAGYGDVGIKEAINAGFIPGPRLLVVTRAISVTLRPCQIWKAGRTGWDKEGTNGEGSNNGARK